MPSTVIKFFNYDDAQRRLRVGFVSGAEYEYLDVPPSTYRRFKSAYSKGNFFSVHIRDHFAFQRIPPQNP